MKKRLLSILSFILACSAIFCFSFSQKPVEATSAETKAQINTQQAKLNQLKEQQKSLQQKKNETSTKKAGYVAQIDRYNLELANIAEQKEKILIIIAKYDTLITETQDEIKDLKEDQKEQKAAFDEMIRMSFEYEDEDYLTLIFGSESFSDFLSRLDMLSYHLEYNKSVLDNLKKTEEKLTLREQQLKESGTELENYHDILNELEEEYNRKVEENNALIKKAESEENEYEGKLDEIEASKNALDEQIKALSLKYQAEEEAERKAREEQARKLREQGGGATSTAPVYMGGTLALPLPSGYMSTSSGYEWRINPITHKQEFHNGLDIPAPSGTPITAAADGTIQLFQWNGGYGNCVIINHGNGLLTLYGHCSRLNSALSVGSYVKAGDVIAYVGTTGQSTGNHLHFTVYQNGNHQNPWNYLR